MFTEIFNKYIIKIRKSGVYMSKFCRICGKELLDDSQFCDGCVTPIEEVKKQHNIKKRFKISFYFSLTAVP